MYCLATQSTAHTLLNVKSHSCYVFLFLLSVNLVPLSLSSLLSALFLYSFLSTVAVLRFRPAFIDPDEIITPVATYPPDELEDLSYKQKKSTEIPITLWMCEFPWQHKHSGMLTGQARLEQDGHSSPS